MKKIMNTSSDNTIDTGVGIDAFAINQSVQDDT
jgi:hypothetical protein